MPILVNRSILHRFSQDKQNWLIGSEYGQGLAFYDQFLTKPGNHCFLIGNTGSGKTQKMRWLASWLCEMETLIIIDPCKNDEIAWYFTLGKPVNVIIPHGCDFTLKTKLDIEYTVQEIPHQAIELIWDFIIKDQINIISLRNYFDDEDHLPKYISQLFKNLGSRGRTGGLEKWTPAAILADEAQSIFASMRTDRTPDAQEAAKRAARIMRDIRSAKIRLIIASQGFYDVQAGARDNSICTLVNRNTHVLKADSVVLNRLNKFSERWTPDKGIFVFPDGRYIPSSAPWSFPFYENPPARIIYSGFVDRPQDTDQGDQGRPVYMGRYEDQMIEQPKEKPMPIGRWDQIGSGDPYEDH